MGTSDHVNCSGHQTKTNPRSSQHHETPWHAPCTRRCKSSNPRSNCAPPPRPSFLGSCSTPRGGGRGRGGRRGAARSGGPRRRPRGGWRRRRGQRTPSGPRAAAAAASAAVERRRRRRNMNCRGRRCYQTRKRSWPLD
uniref:SDG123 n=1 Tax=Arundo donax TaxID=35708 RepID=A0A0A9DM16_ARUDO